LMLKKWTHTFQSAWRHRLPNDYDELVIWDEIFTWRSHMFSAITSNFSWSEPSTLATLHDRPWTTIRMAMAARKQGMKQVCHIIQFQASMRSDGDLTNSLDSLAYTQQNHRQQGNGCF
jgi:hypothetical protein